MILGPYGESGRIVSTTALQPEGQTAALSSWSLHVLPRGCGFLPRFKNMLG